MKIAFFASSILSSYCNEAVHYYRGIVRALHERGHSVTVYESDAFDRQIYRDIPALEWARVVVYASRGSDGINRALDEAANADMIIKAGNVGIFDELMESAVLEMKSHSNITVFWDVDSPSILGRLQSNPRDPLRQLIPQYDLVFVRSGGINAVSSYTKLGARRCIPIYNALDPAISYPAQSDPRFAGDLAFCGNRLPDREERLDDFFFAAARHLPQAGFLLAGNGWQNTPMPDNVRYVGQINPRDFNAFNSTPLTVLNVCRENVFRENCSPSPRIFEAAGAAACIISDDWPGIEAFLEPGREVFTARNGFEVAELLHMMTPHRARSIGEAARKRILSKHTYMHRVELIEKEIGVAISS